MQMKILLFYGDCTAEVIRRLEKVASDMIIWFRLNEMKVNGKKNQLIIFNRQLTENVSIHIDGHVRENEAVVKLLGLYTCIDDLLNFDAHVDNICHKAGRKLNVPARLSGVLNMECRLLLLYSFILSHFEYCTAISNFLQYG